MEEKLEKTVEKTIEAIARIERFILKYGPELSKDQKDRVKKKNKELQDILSNLS